jgi:hypothetical protein
MPAVSISARSGSGPLRSGSAPANPSFRRSRHVLAVARPARRIVGEYGSGDTLSAVQRWNCQVFLSRTVARLASKERPCRQPRRGRPPSMTNLARPVTTIAHRQSASAEPVAEGLFRRNRATDDAQVRPQRCFSRRISVS